MGKRKNKWGKKNRKNVVVKWEITKLGKKVRL